MNTVRLTFLDHGRISEWLTSSVMLGFALTLMMPGEIFLTSAGWALFEKIGIPDAVIAFPLLVMAIARMIGLYANGSWRRSPHIRVAGAITGSVCFSVMSFAFFWPYAVGSTETMSTAVTTYGLLGLFDIIAAYRSGADVKYVRNK